jgi:hypothetical protein
MKPRLPSVHSALLKAALALIVVVLSPSVSQAANKYWDTTGVAGLASGNGSWDVGTTALWSTATAGTALTTFATGDDAFFQTAGVKTVTLDANRTANSMTQATNVTATIAENTITNVAAPGNDVIEVTVTVTGGSATKLFGRLVATKTP